MRHLAPLAITLAAAACATPTATAPPPTAPRDEEVTALKERVNRLERRLSDVDSKLGLLLAQRQGPRPPPTSSSLSHGIDLGPRELLDDDRRTEEASLGARSIDFPRSRRARQVDEESVPVDDDGSAPVLIQLRGEPEPLVTSPEPQAPVGPPAGSSVEDAYAWAQDRLKERKFLEAIAALEEVVQRNPTHDLADNSLYWIGWAHSQRGDHKLAIDVWQRLPLRFPRSAKVPDAMFGMAAAHEALGEPAVAETLYEQLVSQFPKAEKVRDARRALYRLRPR